MSNKKKREYGAGGISAYTNKDGKQFYRIVVRVENKHGQMMRVERRRSLAGKPFKTRTEARAGIKEITDKAAKEGGFAEPSRLTTGDYLNLWLNGLRLKPGTIAYYRRLIRLHVIPNIGETRLTNLRATNIKIMYNDLEDRRTPGKASSPQMIRKVHMALRKALRDAVIDGYIDVNPTDSVTPPAASEARPPEMKYWTELQVREFLTWASEHWSNAMHVIVFRLAFATGARRGELMALRWGDVDFDNERISIRRSVGSTREYGKPSTLQVGSTKTGKERVVDVDPGTVSMLRTFKKQRRKLAFKLSTSEAAIFGDSEGSHTPPDSVSWAFREAQKVYGTWLLDQAEGVDDSNAVELLPVIRFHDIRHTHATTLLAKGVHPKVVQERLGHSDILTTMGTYSHVLPTLQREAAGVIGTAFGTA